MRGPARNTHCPWSGKPVASDSLTCFEGETVGFCNPGCRDKFDRATRCFNSAIEAAHPEATGPVRRFRPEEADELWALMRELAGFEGYLEQFQVTPADLLRYGLGANPQFRAYVAPHPDGQTLKGMAVTYRVPWTYSMRPRLVLKELFVRPSARGTGVGRALFEAVLEEAHRIDADYIAWTVLPDNHPAQAFYRTFGAAPDGDWVSWRLSLKP